MPEIVKEQLTEEWFAAHMGRITSSTAAGCLRLDPYSSAQKSFRKINGTEPFRENEWTEWGRKMERHARLHYECEGGKLVDETGFWVHPELDWLGASPDGLVGDEGLVEIKCLAKIPAKIPVQYKIQMIVQMIVTQRQWCDFVVCTFEQKSGVWVVDGYFVERFFLQSAKGLIERLRKFRETYLLTDTQPPRKKAKRRKKQAVALAPAGSVGQVIADELAAAGLIDGSPNDLDGVE